MSNQSTPRMRAMAEQAKGGSEAAAVLWLLLHDKPTAEQDRVLAEVASKLDAMFRHTARLVVMLREAGLLPSDDQDEPF